jgi:capsular polysaccharide biosynthesis protein
MRWPFRNGIPGADLVVRRVRDVIVLPGGLALSPSGELLTLNFLDNRITEHALARVPLTTRYVYRKALSAKLGPAFDGPVFAADCFWAGNFGHMLLEVVPTLLLVDRAPAEALVMTSAPVTPNTRAMFGQMGVFVDRVRRIEAPVRCAEAYYCQPLMRLSGGSHPLLADAFIRLAQLASQGTIAPLDRIFLSRARVTKRRLAEEQQVEDLFARYGFTIVHPETLKIADQIRLVANATMLAGLGGSAMHLCAMARPETPVLIIQTAHMPQHVDMSIHHPGRRLGYVFGQSLDLSQKIGGGWSVDVAAVETGLKAHFGL